MTFFVSHSFFFFASAAAYVVVWSVPLPSWLLSCSALTARTSSWGHASGNVRKSNETKITQRIHLALVFKSFHLSGVTMQTKIQKRKETVDPSWYPFSHSKYEYHFICLTPNAMRPQRKRKMYSLRGCRLTHKIASNPPKI